MAAISLINPVEQNPPVTSGTHGAYPHIYEVKFKASINSVPTANFYAKFATWIDNPAINLGDNPTNPGSNVFSIYVTSGTIMSGTWYEMKWAGSDNNRYGRCWIKFDVSVGPPAMYVSFRFNYLGLMDLNGYPPATTVGAVDKILKNSILNTIALDNSIPSVYNSEKYILGTFWSQNIASNEWAITRAFRKETLKFYDRDSLNVDKVNCDVHTFSFSRGIVQVNTLHCEDDTLLRLKLTGVTDPSPAPVCRVYIIKTSNPNINKYWPDALPTQLSDLPAPSGSYSDWGVGNTPNVLILPSTAPALVSTNTYEATVTIKASELENGATYRFIAHWGVSTLLQRYVFISDEIICNCCEELNDTNAPVITGTLSDFQDTYGNWVIVSAKNRIRGHLDIDPTLYDATHVKSYADAFCRLRIRYYSYENVVQQIYADNVYIRNLDGTWTLPDDLNNLIEITPDGDIYNFFRIRYESNVPNLQTINTLTGIPLPVASGNMSWINKTIFVEYTIILCKDSGATDTITFIQLVEVRENDTTMVATFNPQKIICSNESQLTFNVTRPTSENQLLVTTLEKTTFGIRNLRETEDFIPATMDQQFSDYIIEQDDSFDGLASADGIIDATALEFNTEYLFCVITKGDTVAVCGSAKSSGGASCPITDTNQVGLNLGDIVVAYQMYSYGIIWGGDFGGSGVPNYATNATDGLKLVWDVLSINTVGQTIGGCSSPFEPSVAYGVPGDGYIKLTKTTETPITANTTIYPTDEDGCTQWWYKLLCPGVFSQCNGTQRADFTQVRYVDLQGGTCDLGYTQMLHEEAFQFGLGDTLGDVTLNFNIPIQTILGVETSAPHDDLLQEVRYRIAIYYNGVEVAATSRLEPAFSPPPTNQTYTFIDDVGTLTFNHDGSADYFVVIVTMWPINIELNTTQLPEFQWTFTLQCPGTELFPPINGCNQVYNYALPNAKEDTGLQTQCFLLPPRQICVDDFKPCDFLWNNNLDCLDRTEFYQPVCVGTPACTWAGYAQMIIDVNQLVFPIDNIAMIFGRKNCKNVTLADLAITPFQAGPAVTSIQLFIDTWLAAIGFIGTSYGEQITDTRFILYFDQEYILENFDIDICDFGFIFCGVKDVDGVLVETDDSVRFIEIAQQPTCCSELPACPPETPTAGCDETDQLNYQFTFPDNLNVWGSETESPEYGWYHDNPEKWLLKLSLTDGCCNIVDTPETKPFWVKCSGVSWNKDTRKPFQSLIIDPTYFDKRFQIAITLNDEICPRTVYSEPYEIISPKICDELEFRTILLKGVYGSKDCAGKFYGDPADQTLNEFCPYVNEYRVYGVLKKSGEVVTRNNVTAEGKSLSTIVDEVYTLICGNPMPPYAAERFMEIMAADEIIIDGLSFQYEGKVDNKSEFESEMWTFEVDLTLTESCTLDSKCNP